VASWGWWPGQRPACHGLAAGRKLCAPCGGRAAGSALRELGGLESVTFPVEATVKNQNSLHGKSAQACQCGCSGKGLASTWTRFWTAFEDEGNVHSAGRDGCEDLSGGCAPSPSRVCTRGGHTCPREQTAAQASRHGRLARARLDFGGILLLPEVPLAAISLPAVFSAVLLSPWLEIVSHCITMASLGTFPFLQLLGNVSPVCMDGLRSFLNEQARIKACASAPISLLPSSALRR